MTIYKIKKDALLFVANFRDAGRTPRPNLEGVLLATGGFLVATDGYILGREANAWTVEQEHQEQDAQGTPGTPGTEHQEQDAQGTPGTPGTEHQERPEDDPNLNPRNPEGLAWIFTKDDLRLIKADKIHDYILIKTMGPDVQSGTLIVGDVCKGIFTIGRTFPAWQKVIPERVGAAIGGFSLNPENLARFAHKTGGQAAPMVKLEFVDEVGPAQVKVCGRPDFLGLIMPVRF